MLEPMARISTAPRLGGVAVLGAAGRSAAGATLGAAAGAVGRRRRAARLLILSINSRLKLPAPDMSELAEGLGI